MERNSVQRYYCIGKNNREDAIGPPFGRFLAVSSLRIGRTAVYTRRVRQHHRRAAVSEYLFGPSCPRDNASPVAVYTLHCAGGACDRKQLCTVSGGGADEHGKLTDKSPFPVCFGTLKKKKFTRIIYIYIIPVESNLIVYSLAVRDGGSGKRRNRLFCARASALDIIIRAHTHSVLCRGVQDRNTVRWENSAAGRTKG